MASLRLRFRETMRGRLRTTGPRPANLPFHFQVAVTAPSAKDWILGKPLPMEGTVFLKGFAKEAPLAGTLRIGLPLSRTLDYSFSFQGNGSLYRFFGQKIVYGRRFFSTMTTLRGRLFRDGELAGDAVLHFRWRDLPAFLWSFAF